ncbi:MAG: hypothetical protein BWK73_22765 [Thiothrix lacustris]|uniref:Uncharacterized protein n=1 Tax=Thiothrix lacustris TaxID=525917 RepID=A0A1Y1QMR5_9GAMM|nr:MAG: hypothetical protein BWK73_22765 [Thiothrix lacustris]
MNIHQLHLPDTFFHDMQECSPCEAASHAATARYWPKVRMHRRHLVGMPDERLSIEISNPWPDLILRYVKIAFLSTGPHSHLKNGLPAVKFAPTHGIEFGEIAYSGTDQQRGGVIRDIIMLESEHRAEGHEIYAGVSFTAYDKADQVKHYGYLLFKSNVLLATQDYDQAA